MKQAMHTQHSDNLQKAAQAVLSGNREDSVSILETELVDQSSCTSTWLLYALNCDSLSEAEDAINQALEAEPENELAATGRRWFEGLRNLATQIEASEEAEAEAQRAEEAEEARRVAEEEEAEAQRKADEEAEAQRAEEEAEARRVAEEEEAEAQRKADEEAEAQRAEEEAEAQRVAEEEAEAQRAEEEAEARRVAEEEAEAQRIAEEGEAQRLAEEEAEAEAQRAEEEAETEEADVEETRTEATEETETEPTETQLTAEEEEELRLAEEDRLAEEAEAQRLAEAEEAELRSQESEEEDELYDSVNELVDDVKSTTTPEVLDVAALASGRDEEDSSEEQEDSRNEQADTPAELESDEKPLVLAVDDSPTIRKLVSMTLSRAGFEVVAAADGVEALTMLADRAPSIILSDINMPRLDGYKLCKFVKRNQGTKHIPVILLSGKDGVFDKMRGKMSGCDGYITKPFESNDLLEKVKSFTGVTV